MRFVDEKQVGLLLLSLLIRFVDEKQVGLLFLSLLVIVVEIQIRLLLSSGA
jgi:hypothetical protein